MSFKAMARLSPLVAAVLVGSALSLAARSGSAHEEHERREKAIVGTWRVQVTLLNCATGQPVAPPFAAFLTFGTGGALTETTSASFFPAVRSPGHGSWTSEGGRSYAAASSAFLTKDGVLFRTQTIAQRIELDGDSLLSNAAVTFTDPAGAVVARGCASAVGARYR